MHSIYRAFSLVFLLAAFSVPSISQATLCQVYLEDFLKLELYEAEVTKNLQERLDEKTNEDVLEVLENIWGEVAQKARELPWFEVLVSKSKTEENLKFEINKARSSPSNTIKREAEAYKAWENANEKMLEWAESGLDITIERALELNSLLEFGFGVNRGGPGLLRKGFENGAETFFEADVYRGIHKVFLWYEMNKTTMHPVELAVRMFQRLVTVHGFSDGNGRTSRLVMDWILIRNGFPPPKFESSDEALAFRGTINRNRDKPTEESLQNITQAIKRTLEYLAQSDGSTLTWHY